MHNKHIILGHGTKGFHLKHLHFHQFKGPNHHHRHSHHGSGAERKTYNIEGMSIHNKTHKNIMPLKFRN